MPLSEKQKEYISSAVGHRWALKTGATRSGKTFVDYSVVIPKRIRSRIGKEGLVVILGVSKSTIERNVLEPMRNLYGEKLVGSIRADNRCYLFGEWCYCLGAEKVSQVSKIRGASIKYCYGDEVAEWNEEVFELLKSRLDKPYSCFDGSLNPESPSHWLKRFIDSDADIYCQKYTIFDNPFLPKEFVDNLCKEYEGSVYYKRYILGEWAIAEGLVYQIFNQDRHVFKDKIEYNQSSQYYLAIDYGTMNPFAVLLIELTFEGRVRVLKCGGHSGRDTGVVLDNEAYYNIIRDLSEGFPIEAIIIDPSAAGMKATIQKYGEFTIRDGNNDVLNGIQEVVKYFNLGWLEIYEDCKPLIDELGAYAYDDKASAAGKDTVIKENDHFCDALRYFIYTIAKIYNRGII